jgi:universal stress protein A
MQSPNRILVPVDFSESSRAALEYAVLLGARFGADVDVFHVWRAPEASASGAEMLARFARSDAGHTMREWLMAFGEQRGVATHGRLTSGEHRDVPTAIVGLVEDESYDLVVMGAHAHHGITHLLKRGVTDKVVRRARCPVVAVHAGGEPSPLPDAGDPLSWA